MDHELKKLVLNINQLAALSGRLGCPADGCFS